MNIHELNLRRNEPANPMFETVYMSNMAENSGISRFPDNFYPYEYTGCSARLILIFPQ